MAASRFADGSRGELAPLRVEDLDELMAIEVLAYAFPWSRGNFIDSLASGYQALGLRLSGELVAYAWAMKGVDEAHLLNLTVHPDHRRRGHAQHLLHELVLWARAEGLAWIWLEVRVSNEAARRLYERLGFEEAGLRRGYYPSARSPREDALLMRLDLERFGAAADERVDAAAMGEGPP